MERYREKGRKSAENECKTGQIEKRKMGRERERIEREKEWRRPRWSAWHLAAAGRHLSAGWANGTAELRGLPTGWANEMAG